MGMKISTIGYFFREAFASLRRNGWMAMASASTAAVALMIFGASMLVVLNTDYFATTVESGVEIAVFLIDKADAQRAFDIGEEIKGIPGVREVKFVSKDEALAELKKNFEQKRGVLDTLGENNPLPDKYRIKVDKPEQVKPTAEKIGAIQGVAKVKYGQGVVEKLFAITRWVRITGLMIMGLLALAAVFLISTTIRLTVFARRREINIAKYLGATDWFIRWPFILEGIILGLVGSLVAVLILYFAYANLNTALQNSFPFIPLQRDMSVIFKVYDLLMGLGVALGAIGSMISVRKFLRV